MTAIQTFLGTTALGSWLKTFIAVIISGAVADWATGGAISFGNWQSWVIAALVSTLAPLLAAINPADPRFGKGA